MTDWNKNKTQKQKPKNKNKHKTHSYSTESKAGAAGAVSGYAYKGDGKVEHEHGSLSQIGTISNDKTTGYSSQCFGGETTQASRINDKQWENSLLCDHTTWELIAINNINSWHSWLNKNMLSDKDDLNLISKQMNDLREKELHELS